MIIRLRVFEQTLSIVSTKSVPRKGSKEYLGLQFTFSSDWKDLDKLCYLQSGDVSLPIDMVDNLVEVPEWFTEQDSFDVTLFGKSGNQEVPTNVVSLRLEKSNTLWEQDAPEPQPSWLAKIIDLNNHPPIPGDNGYWLIWDTDKGAYVESTFPLFEETDPTVPSWAKQTTKPSYTKSEVGLGNVDNVRQYSTSNPPPYPVTSVNGKTGAVNIGAADVGAATETYVDGEVAEATTDMATQTWVEGKGYLTQHQSLSAYRTALAQDAIDGGKEASANKVTSISSSSTDTQYPSAKAVYSFIQSLDGNGVNY